MSREELRIAAKNLDRLYDPLHKITSESITAMVEYVNNNKAAFQTAIDACTNVDIENISAQITKANPDIALLACVSIAFEEIAQKFAVLHQIMNLSGRMGKGWEYFMERHDEALKSVKKPSTH